MKKQLLFLLLIFNIGCLAQSSQPTKSETFEYLRSKIIAFGNEVNTVTINEDLCTFEIYYYQDRSVHKVQNFGNLDANGISWDLENNNTLIAIKISTKPDLTGEIYTDKTNTNENRPYLRMVFKTSKIIDDPKFQEKMTNAYKRLIMLCGGKAEKNDPFEGK